MLSDAKKLRESIKNAIIFPKELIEELQNQKLFNLWVPEEFNGLESSLSDGLKKLYDFAKIDGTLGWTITLCAGANYFIGNMSQEARKSVFTNELPILGGSGGKWGTAEWKQDHFELNGTWKYATGAEYLTHITLNAVLIKDGKAILDDDGEEVFLSFIVPKEAITIISDWDRMGMKATRTNSFSINRFPVSKEFSFQYNHFELPQLIFKIPFRVFADLTLWVNYAGMFAHFVEEVIDLKGKELAQDLLDFQTSNETQFNFFVAQVEEKLTAEQIISAELEKDIFEFASTSVKNMSNAIIKAWPYLGTRAASETEQVNIIFRDFFTATQHHNFIRK